MAELILGVRTQALLAIEHAADGDQSVGWVERSDTHRHPLSFIEGLNPPRLMGIGAECLNPSYRAAGRWDGYG